MDTDYSEKYGGNRAGVLGLLVVVRLDVLLAVLGLSEFYYLDLLLVDDLVIQLLP
ncbi:MAG: hypothetical protein P4M11_07585 [Candidatus Pacebacteria bacterium]|nr:hypothetical protein [Candidatus Paceibacterota bacterium]